MSRFVVLTRMPRDESDLVELARHTAANDVAATWPASAAHDPAERHAGALPRCTALWFWAVPSEDDPS